MNAEQRRYLDSYLKTYGDLDAPIYTSIRALIASHDALERRVGELERLLEPFAKQAEIIDAQRQDGELWPDVAWFRFGASTTAIVLGDCRAARDVLRKEETI